MSPTTTTTILEARAGRLGASGKAIAVILTTPALSPAGLQWLQRSPVLSPYCPEGAPWGCPATDRECKRNAAGGDKAADAALPEVADICDSMAGLAAHAVTPPDVLFAKIDDDTVAEWTRRFGGEGS